MERKLQKTFCESYVKTLRDKLTNDMSTNDYYLASFPYDKSMVKSLAGVYQPFGLAEKMNPEDDLGSAIALYEAYKDISPLLASNENFWIYLTHVDLFEYVQKRWLSGRTKKASNDYIKKHWFYHDNGMMSTTLMGAWWAVYCTIDESRGEAHKYDLTEVLFKSKDFQIRFGSSVLFRHHEAVIGILEYIYDDPIIFKESTKRRSQFITKYFNSLGAVKELAYFNRDFFKKELDKIHNDILSIRQGSNDYDT